MSSLLLVGVSLLFRLGCSCLQPCNYLQAVDNAFGFLLHLPGHPEYITVTVKGIRLAANMSSTVQLIVR